MVDNKIDNEFFDINTMTLINGYNIHLNILSIDSIANK